MMKKALVIFAVVFLYQAIAIGLLYASDYLNVASYYTHPPTKGNIELSRLPVLFGDAVALNVLAAKKKEAEILVHSGNIGIAAVISSYEHNNVLPRDEAKHRALKVAESLILAGYDTSRCEIDDISSAKLLHSWGLLDNEIKSFLVRFDTDGDIFSCY